MKKLILFLLATIQLSCGGGNDGPCHNSVVILNGSSKNIYFQRQTVPQITQDPRVAGSYFKIVSGQHKADIFGRDRGCYEDLFTENGTLYYLLFDEEVLQNNSWSDIVENDMVLKRYSFTSQEMQAAEYLISYVED